MTPRRILALTLLVGLLLPPVAGADVWTETSLFMRYASGDVEYERTGQASRKEDLTDSRFGGQFTFFFPSLKDGFEYEDEPIELRTFLQHPCAISLVASQRERTLDTAAGDSERKDSLLGGSVSFFTPTRNFATGLGADYTTTKREYANPGAGADPEYDDTKLRVALSQYVSRFFRIQLAYIKENVERTDNNSTYEEERTLGELGLKASFGNVVSLELAGGSGKEERGSAGGKQDWELAQARTELGFYFGRYVSLLLGGYLRWESLDEDGPVDVTEITSDLTANLNFWFGEHVGVTVGGFVTRWERKQENDTTGNETTDTWVYPGGMAEVSLRF